MLLVSQERNPLWDVFLRLVSLRVMAHKRTIEPMKFNNCLFSALGCNMLLLCNSCDLHIHVKVAPKYTVVVPRYSIRCKILINTMLLNNYIYVCSVYIVPPLSRKLTTNNLQNVWYLTYSCGTIKSPKNRVLLEFLLESYTMVNFKG